mgnify:CR=1 FL=1
MSRYDTCRNPASSDVGEQSRQYRQSRQRKQGRLTDSTWLSLDMFLSGYV